MKRYSVLRTNLSPYQISGFKDLEKKRLEELSLDYLQAADEITENTELILITNTHTKFEELPEIVKNQTRLVIHPNSGYENFAPAWSELSGIPVIIGHEVRAQAVAEYSLSCFVDFWTQRPHQIEWDKTRLYPRTLMKDSRALIVGYGHIGKTIESMLQAIGVQTTTVDPKETADVKNITDVSSEFDSVIICAGLNSHSNNLINKTNLEKLKPKLLINAARGGIINETDLVEYLTQTQAKAYLDVFEKEPLPANSLQHERLFKTSHIAGVHESLDLGIIEFEYKVIQEFLTLARDEFMVKYENELLMTKWFHGELW